MKVLNNISILFATEAMWLINQTNQLFDQLVKATEAMFLSNKANKMYSVKPALVHIKSNF